MSIRKKFVLQQAMSIMSGAKTKHQGVAGWKVGQTWHRDNCSHAKKYNKNIETLLAKQNISLLIWDRQLKFLLQHQTVWFDRKQSKYLSKELLLYDFLHQRSTDVWKTVPNSACRPLYQKTSEKSSLVILEIDLTSKPPRYVPLSSGTLWKVSFWPVWKLR